MNETNNTPELVQNTVDSVDIDNASTVLNPGIDKKIDSENPKENEDINSPLESETQPKTVRIPLTIRCPFTTTDLNIYIDPSSTVAHLKRKICKEFPSNPKPSDQRLIFGGRIILNNEILSDVLKRQMCDLSTPPTIHLIINSLALQNAKSAKQPSNHTNSENVSAVTSPSSNTQVSSEELKQNLNESSASDSNLASPNVINSDVKETEAQSAPTEANPTNIPIATPEANVMNLKVTEPSTSTASEVNTDLSTDKTTTTATVNSDAIQYVLIK
ncbi:hypothetical protein BCR36DRAFT_396006 [Piromyces finnis]|uniref:Ubiquitin-like domain-containing protein n=1 Tax=Piromyces finnis TaxID=1754191 RepID=A0A1Y1VGA0_9FUNG|nr:hypothetical protein BCR36DRAFT_396006 [Piromyces finnis]|eukprot:ORX55445.1 hypothetical protein BCR36DRAFT_396006 [Piromyces finnis]